MTWLGSLEERHMGYGTAFMDGEKAAGMPLPLPGRLLRG